MDISCIFFGILFTIVGLLFAGGKLHTHITAWKNMSDEEKNKINIKPLVRNIGAVIVICGILFLLKGFIVGFTGRLFVAAMILWMIGSGFDLWHISKSSRYQKK